MKKGTLIILSLFISLVAFVSCNTQEGDQKNSNLKIIGKWYAVKKPSHNIEFFLDNTLQYNGGGEANGMAGSWMFLDDGRVKIELTNAFGGKGMVLGTVGNNRLTIDLEDKEFIKAPDKTYNYFPLEKRTEHEYSTETTSKGVKSIGRCTKAVLSPIDIEGVFITPVSTMDESGKEQVRLFYLKNEDGVLQVGQQLPSENEPSYSVGDYKIVYPILPGVTWGETEDANTVVRGDSKVSYEILSIDDEVKINKHVYKNCLKIYYTNSFGNTKTTSWYAPDIGLVKEIIDADEYHFETTLIN